MMHENSRTFSDAVEKVSRQLVSVQHSHGFSLVSTPLLYPGGSSVVIRIMNDGASFFVTDYSMGYAEAEMMGASPIFARHARIVAERVGVGFDNHAFFVMRVPSEKLAAAIVIVANCSQETVYIAAHKAAERRATDDAEALYQRLITVFSPNAVARNVEIEGLSQTKWTVANLVREDGARTIFEPVSNHHTSVFAVTTKFHDIAQLEDAPRRIAVVRNKSDLKTWLGVLSQASNVIERGVADADLVSYARAA